MILTSEGRILSINGSAIIRKANTLTFNVEGLKFPNFSFATTSNGFLFLSSISQKIIANWGDGLSEVIQMKATSGNAFGAGWTQNGVASTYVTASVLQPVHDYADRIDKARVITFMFEDLTKLIAFSSNYILLNGSFPVDLLRASSLDSLIISAPKNMTTLPGLSENKKLLNVSFSEYSDVKINRIPDTFFDINPKSFRGTRTFNLSDKIASNLFKINQWTKLEVLDLEGCEIVEFDSSFSECVKLVDLRLGGTNNFTSFPEEITNFVDLVVLYIRVNGVNTSFIDFSFNNKIGTISFSGDFNLTEIPTKWVGLKSLKTIGVFQAFVSLSKFNQFIDLFYELCTAQGSVLPNESGAPYPNRFRNISWGHGTYTFTGSKVAPNGYIQGVSNGAPINQGQKVYVLQNQYNHVITHA